MVEKVKMNFHEAIDRPVKTLLTVCACFLISAIVLEILYWGEMETFSEKIFIFIFAGWVFGGMIYAWRFIPINLKGILLGGATVFAFPWSFLPWALAGELKLIVATFGGLIVLPLAFVVSIVNLIRKR